MTRIVLALIFTLSLSEATAQCDNASSQTQMNACYAQLKTQSERDLNQAANQYKARLSPQQTEVFNRSQSAWTLYQKTACTFQASGVEGGSAYPMVLAQCLTAKAKSRLAEIQALARCEEGDLSCPVGSSPH